MKKIIMFLLPVLAIAFFYSCNSGGGGEAYTIKMRLNKADTFIQDMQMNMKMNSAGIDMNMNMNTATFFEVIKGGDEKDLKLTYRKMKITMDMGKFNNTVPDSIKNRPYDNIIGKSVILKLSKDNEIMDVSGFDQFITSTGDSATNEMMKKMFTKDQLNSSFGMLFSMYPKKPVKVGETWNGETIVKMANLDMKLSNKYKLLSVKNGLAEISIDGTVSAGGDIMKESSGLKMDMNGTQNGTMTLRLDNGYLHNGNYKMDIKVEMQMMGQKLPMTMKANCILKGI